MSRKTTRTRKGVRTDAHAEPQEDRASDVHLGRAVARGGETPSSASTPHTRLSAGDLEALASMDRDELAALMGGALGRARVEEGDRVTGTITRIGREYAFVDIGAKAEATLGTAELKGEQAGDTIEAFVLSAGEGGIQLSRQLSGRAAGAFLDEAADSGIPVEGRVASRNAGGFEVRIGTVRAFCPVSMIDRHPAPDLDVYVGQTFRFQVVEAGDEPVVSRRALLEEEAEAAREQFFATAKPGDHHTGIVTSIQSFGVFVDIGGVEGLVHRSELGWESDDPTSLARGQHLEVRVLEVDIANGKVSLSARDPALSPWSRIGTDYVPGSTYEGTVTGVERYGVFVRLAPGLQGLLHVSRRTTEGLPHAGATITVRLVSADLERRRLELADPDWSETGAPTTEQDAAWRAHEQEAREGSGSLGTLGDLFEGLNVRK